MKFIVATIFLVISFCNAAAKEKSYIASTPAGKEVRTFLGISLSDSVDFIRWKLTLDDQHYTLVCTYGVSQPNTNGFVNNGIKVALSGVAGKTKEGWHLENAGQLLNLIEVNSDLIHLADEDDNLLVGNGGWSCTLNSLTPQGSDFVKIKTLPTNIKDSIVIEGRTPCQIPGIVEPGNLCYKLKWLITFHATSVNNGYYLIKGTRWRTEGGVTGKWISTIMNDGKMMYELKDSTGKSIIHLLKISEQLFFFTDEKGKPLTGNEDFSYTLNRRI